MSNVRVRAISLGAGVQSTTVALLAKEGLLPMPDCAIFADTQWEPEEVYRHLDWLCGVLPFPVHRVTAGSLREHILQSDRSIHVPFYVRTATGTGFFFPDAELGRLSRQCTDKYKLRPIARKLYELLDWEEGRRPLKGSAEIWIGISRDEVQRMRPPRAAWQVGRWPLIDEVPMTRDDCLAWLRDHGYPEPPKSACLGCPFMSDARWLAIKMGNPGVWADLVEMDRKIRNLHNLDGKHQVYMHRTCVPLDEVIFAPERELKLFGNECTGFCGV